jgi:hypothetical protein
MAPCFACQPGAQTNPTPFSLFEIMCPRDPRFSPDTLRERILTCHTYLYVRRQIPEAAGANKLLGLPERVLHAEILCADVQSVP